MIDRRRTVIALAGAIAAAPFAAAAQQRTGAAMPIILQVGPSAGVAREGFRHGLDELGYVAGKSVDFVNLLSDRREDIASSLFAHKIDLIFALGPAAVGASARATKTLPIIAIDLESDPVGEGLVAEIARPGGNITGAFLDHPALTETWLELVRAIVPQASRIAVHWDPTTGPALLRAIESAARSVAIRTGIFAAPGPDYISTFRDMAKTEPQALVLLSSPLIFYHRLRLAELARQARLPTIAMFKAFAVAGGLIACGPDAFEVTRRSASQADKILKGQRPSDIPIDVPARYELVINMKTAAMLGVPMPLSLLARADRILE